MPAGDLLVADYQAELRATLTGAGTVYEIDEDGISGLGVPGAKTADVDLGHSAGAYLGRDYTGMRVITIPYLVHADTAALAWSQFQTLSTVWASSETDVPLHLRLPGAVRLSCNGRPRGLADDLSLLGVGVVRALATFACGSPTLVRVPAAPTIGTATAGVGQATANWTAPADNGGSAVTGYQVTTYRASDNVVLFTDTTGVVLTFTRTGLTAGVGVYFKVAAINVTGTGPQSAASNTVTPT